MHSLHFDFKVLLDTYWKSKYLIQQWFTLRQLFFSHLSFVCKVHPDHVLSIKVYSQKLTMYSNYSSSDCVVTFWCCFSCSSDPGQSLTFCSKIFWRSRGPLDRPKMKERSTSSTACWLVLGSISEVSSRPQLWETNVPEQFTRGFICYLAAGEE